MKRGRPTKKAKEKQRETQKINNINGLFGGKQGFQLKTKSGKPKNNTKTKNKEGLGPSKQKQKTKETQKQQKQN